MLASSSGPWYSPLGETPATGPKFAELINDPFATLSTSPERTRPLPDYLWLIGLSHNYHFTANRLMVSAVNFEARLRDAQGVVIKTIKFPDNSANFWLQYRYKLLALGLGNDQPVQARAAEAIPAPGKETVKVTIWDTSDPKLWQLKQISEHLVPKDRQVMRPSDWSLLLARAYERFLLREYPGATSVELIRHSRDQVSPEYLYSDNPPPAIFEELVCSFGVARRDK